MVPILNKTYPRLQNAGAAKATGKASNSWEGSDASSPRAMTSEMSPEGLQREAEQKHRQAARCAETPEQYFLLCLIKPTRTSVVQKTKGELHNRSHLGN